MRRETGFLVGFVLLLGLLAMAMITPAGAGNLPEATRDVPEALSLPGSLNAFYPPVAKAPVYLLKMVNLETSFSGIVVDLMEDDFDGARDSFADFRTRYRELAAMVPEWRGGYPEGVVQELGAALVAGDRRAAMKAFAAVGEACHRCHIAAMVPVQQKYHWGDFSGAAVRDPLSGEMVAYPKFKQFLSANLAGITNDLRQGQADNARKQYEAFRARFDALGGSCGRCHEKESRHFVDSGLRATVDRLGGTLQGVTVVAESVASLVQEIGRESCSKCHRVHLPAAHAAQTRR